MKQATAIVCLSALLFGAQAVQVTKPNPVVRVVNLLQGLSKQIQKEGEEEEKLFDSFVCWGTTAIEQKTASNSKAQSRIDSLKTYIADLKAGKVELTTERGDLEKEIEELSGEIEQAKAMRQKENEDFENAKAEMEMAAGALADAINVMSEATGGKKGELITVKSNVNGGVASLAAQSASLNKAVDLGDRFLTKADASFLRRVLTGDVPKRDHKKLGRKADFKMKYQARSTKIQDVLGKLHKTFSDNLEEAITKEKEAEATFQTLMYGKDGDGGKEGQLAAAQDAHTRQDVEKGAQGFEASKAQEEADSLQAQIDVDTKFIEDTHASIDKKKAEWAERSDLRKGELTAITDAIEILYNDDARDMFSKQYKGKGFLFLQQRSQSASAAFGQAATELKNLARRTGSRQLSALAALATQAARSSNPKDKFGDVITSIDEMLSVLHEDEQHDLKTKEDCEKDRMHQTKDALVAARTIDEQSEAIYKLEADIKEVQDQIKNTQDEFKQSTDELDQATKMREQEHQEFMKSQEENQQAADTVKSAQEVLKSHYKESFGAEFMQKRQPDAKKEGEAPDTWGGSYGGKTKEASGIIHIIEIVHQDMLKDMEKADQEEHEADEAFNKMKEHTEAELADLDGLINKLMDTEGHKEGEKIDMMEQRTNKKSEWDAVMGAMKEVAPHCEYYAENYKMRAANRQNEADGLRNAKTMLQAAQNKGTVYK